ncbi:hypothetical protein BOTBODRAFT_31106 [Botryobasidium botryosum FD-172 SS1]|uniref:Uncharacterized protein n=1 Tax=Botryobasidium botryosum (strain FD-172 SS1) TaxID=930990 RepID=A0A067MKE2_BOTB1|nr:hypothetical protein BOTBODRAFT_31106 [Botryobasidium botryosum FD-172 SS1]
MAAASLSTPLPTGWLARATPSNATPARSTLSFALLSSTPVDPSGFIAAFFLPNILVTGAGHTLQLPQHDFDALQALARRAVDPAVVPQPGGWGNQWRIKHRMTCRPIDKLRVIANDGEYGGKVKVVSVYGFDGVSEQLEKEVGGSPVLHPALMDAFRVLKEPKDSDLHGEGDQSVVVSGKALLEDD